MNTMSNTQQGLIVVVAGDTLTSKEGYLVKLGNNAGVPTAYLPTAQTDFACYLVEEGAAIGSYCTLRPIESGRSIRVVAGATTFVAGDKVIAYGGTAAGQAMEWASGAAFIVGIAEETGDTAAQLLLVRPILGYYT